MLMELKEESTFMKTSDIEDEKEVVIFTHPLEN